MAVSDEGYLVFEDSEPVGIDGEKYMEQELNEFIKAGAVAIDSRAIELYTGFYQKALDTLSHAPRTIFRPSENLEEEVEAVLEKVGAEYTGGQGWSYILEEDAETVRTLVDWNLIDSMESDVRVATRRDQSGFQPSYVVEKRGEIGVDAEIFEEVMQTKEDLTSAAPMIDLQD